MKMTKYTCADYRAEMILLGLKRRLQNEILSKQEKQDILEQIKTIEADMQLE